MKKGLFSRSPGSQACPPPPESRGPRGPRFCHAKKVHAYEVRPRKDQCGVNLVSDALPFGRLWNTQVSHAMGYAKFGSRSHNKAVIRVYDDAGTGGLLLSRQTLSAARFLCRMRIAASSARRFNSASRGVTPKNSKSRLLISSSPVLFALSFF